jgi:hypothetical protein
VRTTGDLPLGIWDLAGGTHVLKAKAVGQNRQIKMDQTGGHIFGLDTLRWRRLPRQPTPLSGAWPAGSRQRLSSPTGNRRFQFKPDVFGRSNRYPPQGGVYPDFTRPLPFSGFARDSNPKKD